MKRKIYATARERRIDQLIGFVAFYLVSIAIWFVADRLLALATAVFHISYDGGLRTLALLIPWCAHGIVVVPALVFRPHIAIGYMVAISMTFCASVIMGALFMTYCFGFCGAAVLDSFHSPLTGPTVWWLTIALPIGALLLFGAGMLVLIILWRLQK